MSDNHDVQLSVRVPRQAAARLSDLATHHGRTRSEEIRAALEIHDARATLAYLKTGHAADALGADVARREQARARALLRRIEASCFGPRPAFPLLDRRPSEALDG